MKEKDKTYWCSKKHCLGSCYRNCDIVELNNRRLKTIAISVVTIGSIFFLIFALSGCNGSVNTCGIGYIEKDTIIQRGTIRHIETICIPDTSIDNQETTLYMNPDGNVTTIPVGTPLN